MGIVVWVFTEQGRASQCSHTGQAGAKAFTRLARLPCLPISRLCRFVGRNVSGMSGEPQHPRGAGPLVCLAGQVDREAVMRTLRLCVCYTLFMKWKPLPS